MSMEPSVAAEMPLSGPPPAAPLLDPVKSQRLLSLDVLRGMTIAGMILVNNPGTWNATYAPLRHAPWDGWTPTDLVFPFFLFMVGVAMTLSFDRRLAAGASRGGMLGHVAARSLVLILLGLVLTGIPNFRLITPFILAIAGLQLVTRKPDADSRVWTPAGWGALAAGVLWWLVDFRYFNGPTARSAFGDFFPLQPGGKTPIRIPGVLQRIGLCYLFASMIALNTRVVGRAIWAAILMLGYWLVMKFVNAPAGYAIGNGAAGIHVDAPAGAPFAGVLNDWIDVRLLGQHLYSHRPDPEGLLSTIPAIATVLIGTLAGTWILRPDQSRGWKAVGLVAGGVVLVMLGQIWNVWFPINKKIWTSSYVLHAGGLGSLLLALCYWLCDILNIRRWAIPFAILGTNAIVAFFGSGLMARLMGMIKLGEPGKETSVKGFLYLFYESSFESPKNESLAWALSFVTLWVLMLWPLYRKRIFIRV
ncbi:MAG: acyltransferase family protein [Candidatus Sumerlaeaceae bacterium]